MSTETIRLIRGRGKGLWRWGKWKCFQMVSVSLIYPSPHPHKETWKGWGGGEILSCHRKKAVSVPVQPGFSVWSRWCESQHNPCFWFPQFKGYFKTTAPQDTDYVGLLDDDLLDQAPSEPVEISLPKSQDGELWPKIGHAHIFIVDVCV